MGVELRDLSPRSSFDDDDDAADDPEAALNPGGDDDDGTVAPMFRLRRLPQGRHDAQSASSPAEGSVMSVYVMMHRYATYHTAGSEDNTKSQG